MTDTIPDSVRYTKPSDVLKIVRDSDFPKSWHLPASGYGNKIPTSFRILYRSGVRGGVEYAHWRRVYVICYSNVGSAYIIVKGHRHFLDTETESKCEEMYNKEETK
jgi:hypothetical protein